jgi:hypothetical protein
MTCCRPSCGVAMLVVGAAMASGDLGRTIVGELVGSGAMMWIAILVIVALASFVSVSSAETGEPS